MEQLTDTKTLILAQAQTLFANRGFDGVSMSDIAKTAGIGKSLIYHYFASKEELWRAVKEQMFQNAGYQQLTLPIDQGLAAFIRTALTMRYEIYQRNPDLARMVQWQSLSTEPENLSGGNLFAQADWLNAIKQLQKQGEINAQINPKFVLAYLLSVVSSSAYSYMQTQLTRAEQVSYLDFLTEQAVNYLKLKLK